MLNAQQISKITGKDVEDVKAAMSSDEVVDLDVSGVKVISNEEFDSMQSRYEAEREDAVKAAREEAKKAGLEIAIKEARNSLGLEFEGKNMDNLLNAFKAKTLEEASIEPNQQITSLTKDIESLKNTIAEKEALIAEKDGAIESIKSDYKNKQDQSFITKSLISEYDKVKDKVNISQTDFLDLYTMRNELKVEGETIKHFKNGEEVKDDLRAPIDLSVGVNSFLSAGNYFKTPRGGRGKGSEHSGPETMESYTARLVKQGVKGQELSDKIAEWVNSQD